MIKSVLFVLSGLAIGILFVFIKNKITNKTKEVIGEKFDSSKLVSGLTNITSPTNWAKTISTFFNVRVLIIIGILVGVIYGYGFYKGRLGKPVHFNLQGKEATIKLNDHYLRIEKNGTANVIDKDGKVLKQIKVKDIPELRKAMLPYGFILNPVAVAGFGISNASINGEGGIGLRYLKWYNWYADVCITNRGAYPLGISYKITDNTAIGLSVGTGYKKEERGFFERWLAKVTIKF